MRVRMRLATSFMNDYAEPASRPPTSHDTIHLLSASSAVQVHMSP